jgi:hypothetical protein
MSMVAVTPVSIVQNAAPAVKLVVLLLLVLNVAAIAISIRKVASGARLPGGSAFLSGLRLGGPLTGFLGAAWGGLAMAMGLANVAGPVPTNILARGAAEVMLLIVLGLLTGAVAVVANWAVEARIDRAVLKG